MTDLTDLELQIYWARFRLVESINLKATIVHAENKRMADAARLHLFGRVSYYNKQARQKRRWMKREEVSK